VQSVLTSAGFNATVQPIPISELFQYRTAPESKVPNIVIELENPDTATPTNFAQIYYGSNAFLNFLHGGSKAVDNMLVKAQQATTLAKYQQLAGQALDMLYQQADFILTADVKGAFVASHCLHGYSTNPVAPYQLNFAHASIKC
jgi:ABC-type transport system substrate-binding protein